MKRRNLLTGAAALGAAGALGVAVPGLAARRVEAEKGPGKSKPDGPELEAAEDLAKEKARLTGVDRDTMKWQVGGTDLGIPYLLENKSVGFLFGDTFNTRWWNDEPLPNDWRSPVMLRSNRHPAEGIVFDSAAGVAGEGRAPELMHNGHHGDDGAGTHEVTVIPNDAVAFDDGTHVMSYFSVAEWYPDRPNEQWRTNYAGLAHSKDGNLFQRTPTVWWNDGNSDPLQMWTMQRDGDHVYVFSVRAGRQQGPMILRRVPAGSMFEPSAYEEWGRDDGGWGWGKPRASLIDETRFGEPSVRRLDDGTWVMAYLDGSSGSIVSRKAEKPEGPWSAPKNQVTQLQQPAIYGGFIHPYSSSKAGDLHLLVSRWPQVGGQSHAYDVTHWYGTA